MRTKLWEEKYTHPMDEGYIGSEENWAYTNLFVQPCYAPTWSLATTEDCNWGPVTPTFKTDVGAGQFSWTGIRSSNPKGGMEN
eukprot:CAMPEP_0172172674 /NCGR_PEP_ID=MMETSP1050-20130122/12584_1 /TAXON_ID=233186 /ORGANISM="Cryptomonas curvata, Strain CCAP979/52" /LENGTH=82 /DNA_ID=CAMNT_0012844253 /DNA_START=294 /DNA_END=542 /DNA_ORIENTATION=-